MSSALPAWGLPLLCSPGTSNPLQVNGDRLVHNDGRDGGRIENGIIRFPIVAADDNIGAYKLVEGAHFFERSSVPFAMSALDTPVYHQYLADIRPVSKDALIVDVGGADGRNARPWLEHGFKRVVVVDAVADALIRFRTRIEAEHPEWLDRVLLIECDARSLPLPDGCAASVLAIESLYYLNDDYERGLLECVRVLQNGGQILLSERDYEGGLFVGLLYSGIAAMLETRQSHRIVDRGTVTMRTRCFGETEIVAMLERNHLRIRSVRGISIFALVLGWMRNKGLLNSEDTGKLDAVQDLLRELGREGHMRRCHVIVAERIGNA